VRDDLLRIAKQGSVRRGDGQSTVAQRDQTVAHHQDARLVRGVIALLTDFPKRMTDFPPYPL
jgi:hypothetical protein